MLSQEQLSGRISRFSCGEGDAGVRVGSDGVPVIVHREVQQFSPGGDAKFIEDAKQIILDRVRAELKRLRDLAIGHSGSEVLNDFALASGKKIDSFIVCGGNAGRTIESLKDVLEFIAACPDLSFVNATNALAKVFELILL